MLARFLGNDPSTLSLAVNRDEHSPFVSCGYESHLCRSRSLRTDRFGTPEASKLAKAFPRIYIRQLSSN
jgi:hypothetical protein